MRLRWLALFACVVAASAAVAAAAESDEIGWIRSDGAGGWKTRINRDIRPAGVVASALTASPWYPKFPAIKIPLAKGGALDPASVRGRVLVVDFWASWCAPCLQELPHLQRLYASVAPRGAAAIAINADEDAATALQTAKRLGLTMTIGLNEPALYRALGVRSLPTVLVVDRQGRVRARWDGYRAGLEKEIAHKVEELMADETDRTSRSIAEVLAGAGTLRALWYRDVPGSADGIVGLPPGHPDDMRVLASAGGSLLAFDADGEPLSRLKASSWAGRLLDFGVDAAGSREIVGYRPGGTTLGVVSLRAGTERSIECPAPIVDVAVEARSGGDRRHLAIATMGGAMFAGANDARALPLDGAGAVRAVASWPGRGVLALRADGSVSSLDASAPAWPAKAAGASRLLAADGDGVAVGPRTAIAAVAGRFLPGTGRQLAVATYAGHLVLLEASDGRILFDAVWPDLHDLAATDLDGDGRDELLVGAGRSIAALGAPAAR